MRSPLPAPRPSSLPEVLPFGPAPGGCTLAPRLQRGCGNVHRRAAQRLTRARTRSEKPIDGDGKRADAPTGGVVHRVGDGRRHANESNLAKPLDPDRAEL